MDRKEILKQAKHALDLLNAQKDDTVRAETEDNEAIKLALLLESFESVSDAIERNAIRKEDIAYAVRDAIAQIKIEVPKIDAPSVSVNVPDIQIPKFETPVMPEIKTDSIVVAIKESIKEAFKKLKFPEPKEPKEIKLPQINIPETNINFPERMDVGLSSFTHKSPMPVMQVDPAGNFVAPSVGSGGGKSDFFTIKGFSQSAYSEYTNPDGRIRVSMESGGGGLTDTELRAASIPVTQVSGASFSVSATTVGNSWLNITGATTSTVVKTGPGVVHTVTINTRGTGSVCTLYGDLVGEGSAIAAIDTTLSTTAFLYDIAFTSGLTVVTSGASAANLTISYS